MAKLVDKYKGKPKAERIGEGTQPARIVQVIRLGNQETEWKGVKSNKPQIWLTFELPFVTIEIDGEEKPRWISKRYTESTNEKSNLRKVIDASNPKAEDWDDLLGCDCLISIGSTENGNDKVLDCMKTPKGMTVPELVNDPVYFDIDNPDQDILGSLPDFLKEMVMSSEEFKENPPF